MKTTFASMAVGLVVAVATFFIVRPHVAQFCWAYFAAMIAYLFVSGALFAAFEAIEENR